MGTFVKMFGLRMINASFKYFEGNYDISSDLNQCLKVMSIFNLRSIVNYCSEQINTH